MVGDIRGSGDCFLQAVLAGCIYELGRAVKDEDDPRKERIKSLNSMIVRKAVVKDLKEGLMAE